MKLKINNEYEDVDFWSFVKCNVLAQLAITGLIYGFIAIVIIIWAVIIPMLSST